MVANRINGKEIAEKIREEIAIKVRNLKNNHQVIPGLAVIIDGEVSQLGMLDKVGERSEVHFLPAIGGG